MDNDNPFPDTVTSVWQRFVGTVRGIGARLLVHVTSLLVASMALPSDRSSGGMLLAYVGLVCLVPRGIRLTGQWLIPTCAGIVCGGVLAALGMPWNVALFWMGAQTWLIRLARSRGKMGWEWTALPWLMVGAILFFSKVAPESVRVLPVLVVPVMTAGGLAVNLLYNRLYIGPIHRNRLKAATANLRRWLAREDALPALEPACQQLAQQCDLLLRHGSFSSREVVAFVVQVEDSIGEMNRTKASGRGAATYGQVLSVQRKLDALSREMELHVRASGALERAEEQQARERDNGSDPQFAEFHTSAVDLLYKKSQLPPHLRGHIVQIAGSTENILECMRSDQADRGNGTKFLAKYLPAAHKIVDQYLRLSRDGGDFAEVTRVLAQSEEVLARLEQAFKDEHRQLVSNDTIQMTAELNVLNTLLKMEGR